MYDDYDLDYTYDYSSTSSLDEDYADMIELDENDEHARESTDFQELAYMHYAWCISTRFALLLSEYMCTIMEGNGTRFWYLGTQHEIMNQNSSWGTRVFFFV